MCLTPFNISNPNYRASLRNPVMQFKDTESFRIDIPCGRCSECIAVRQSEIVQRCEVEAKYKHLFFCTLTYDNEHLPLYETINNDGVQFSYPYAEIMDLQLMFKRLRDNFERDFKYLAVSELGSSRGRPHFHVLFFVDKYDSDDSSTPRNLESELFQKVAKYFARNVGTRKNPKYEPLFTYKRKFTALGVRTNYDLHWVNPSLTAAGDKDVSYYVSKYVTKPSDREQRRQQAVRLNFVEPEYEHIWSVIRCRMVMSKGLGLNASFVSTGEKLVSDKRISCEDYVKYLDYLDTCDDLPLSPDEFFHVKFHSQKRRKLVPCPFVVEELHSHVLDLVGQKDYPAYINTEGKKVPLAKYYKRYAEIFSMQDALTIYFNFNPDLHPRRSRFDLSLDDYIHKYNHYEKVLDQIESHSSFDCGNPALE